MTGPRHAATCLVALDARSGLPGPARHACEGLLGRRQLRGRSSGAKEEPEGRATRRHRKPRTKRDRRARASSRAVLSRAFIRGNPRSRDRRAAARERPVCPAPQA